jgi:hypothetical protein
MHPPVDHNSARWMHPPPGDAPFIVNVRIAVKSIKRVSTLQQNFFVRLGVVFYWTDSRLVDWADDELPLKLWCPKLLCSNREDSFVVAPDGLHLLDAAAGRLKRGYNMDGYVSNQLDYLELFPFDLDAMDLRLYTESNWETPSACESGMSPKHRLYRLLPVVPDTGEGNFWWFGWDGSIEEFTLHGYSYFIEEHAATASGALGTSVHLKFHVSRRPDFYLTKVITPLIMLWQMQAWTFFLDDDDLPKRIAHVSTLLLTACAMVYVVSGFLPKLAFLTEIDRTMQALFVTIVCNGWLEIVAHTVRQRHPSVHDIFKVVWFAANIIVFTYFQWSCYVVPYRIQAKARRELDRGVLTTTQIDPRFRYTVHGAGDGGHTTTPAMRRRSRSTKVVATVK